MELQAAAIRERMSKFAGRLYLEIGGKFLHDPHAARVLPGFDPESKKKIFGLLAADADIIFCMNYKDIIGNRQLTNEDVDYVNSCKNMVQRIHAVLGIKPSIAVNMIPREEKNSSVMIRLMSAFAGYDIFRRYMMDGYPEDTNVVLSKNGYGKDEYIPVSKKLVIVTGAASNSGKMSTCLGQIFHEYTHGVDSGYAKYETFPIRNLPLEHPINLAYEAATIDIGDYNMYDPFHEKAYGIKSVNYNRDVEAFDIVKKLADGFLPAKNFTRSYQSPTDMGINMAGSAIISDTNCCTASLEEILRRKDRYAEIVARGEGDAKWLKKADELYKKAAEYKVE
ncbi:DUF1846 family protein [Patescibacteria group bacterium]|nr:DUF1846 family protein [Patescibacteria group bacterium]